jgi:hypothetical protein
MLKPWKYTILLPLVVVLFARFVVFPDKLQFEQFMSALHVWMLPVVFLFTAVGLIGSVVLLKRPDIATQQLVRWASWTSAICLGAVFLSVVAYVKLTT